MLLKKTELSRFGRRIRRARLLLGFTQKDFAAKCDLDPSYLGGIERGERNLTFSILCMICNGLDCDIAALTKDIPRSRPGEREDSLEDS